MDTSGTNTKCPGGSFTPLVINPFAFQFDVLEQLGFEGYSLLINTGELQTHLLATSKGKSFHKMRQQTGKPLENPFIGYVFSDDAGMYVFLLHHTGVGRCMYYVCVHV